MTVENSRKIIGISNTYMRNRGWLEHAAEDIKETLTGVRKVIILPYALADMDWYLQKLGETFAGLGISSVDSPHNHPGSEHLVIEDAEAIYIGGGNTGRLVANLHSLRNDDGTMVDNRADASRNALVSAIRNRVGEGMPLLGASAGLNVMCDDTRTTNDMHIAVQKLQGGVIVSRLDALGIFPSSLSINPHYLEKITVSEEARKKAIEINQSLGKIIDHQGESRETRLREVLEMDPGRTVLALREGAYLVVDGCNMKLKGETGGLIFNYGRDPVTIQPGKDLSYLLS